MIRTVVEVEGKDEWEFKNNLVAAMDRLGFQRKDTEDETNWRRDIYRALVAKGIEPQVLVNEYRKAQGET